MAAKVEKIARVSTESTQQVWENNAMQAYSKKGLTQRLTTEKNT
jgi:hypothetical protein